MENQKRICVAICFGSSNHFTGLQVHLQKNKNYYVRKYLRNRSALAVNC